jgi:hypothetical protein
MFIMSDQAQGAGVPLTDAELRQALTAMHHGLLGMQARLDDHEKVIEKLLLVMQELTAGKVPDGFRQPSSKH